MGYLLSQIFAFLTLTLVSSHAALPPQQLYWNSVFPDTPMPKALSPLVQPSAKNFLLYKQVEDEQTRDDTVADNQLLVWPKHFANDDVAARNLLLKDPTRVVVFVEKDVHPGKTMKYSLIRSFTRSATFLSRNTAESIPFSSSKLSEILNLFSLQPMSVETYAVREAIQKCEIPPMRGEEKYCATSFESMIDFATSRLGRDIQAISTEVEEGATHVQNYTISHGVKKLADEKIITCHRLRYPYVVFYCHELKNTSTYVVPLKGADGTTAKAVTTCHEDTSEWDPLSFVLQTLKVKPGTDPVCHFLSESDVVWVSNQHKPASLEQSFASATFA